MKTIKAEIKLYNFDELGEKSKDKAREQHFNFLCETPIEFENSSGEMVFSEDEPIMEEVEESIRINEYWFFENGELADTITYMGKHEKSGKTEFFFNGETYLI